MDISKTIVVLTRELIRAKYINAKREKEAYSSAGAVSPTNLWEGQEIAFKQLLDIIEGQ